MAGEEEARRVDAPLALGYRRAALLLEYDGGGYRGLQWQREERNTVQERVEEACAKLGVPEAGFVAAGRTDTGVHAVGQVVAVNLPAKFEERRIGLALNSLLPMDIRVRKAAFCAPDFSPRHDAVMRTYIYRLCAGVPVTPVLRNYVAQKHCRLDPVLTQAAAAAFVGQWELCEWRSSICQAKRTFLTITEASATPPAEEGSEELRPYWQFRFRARSFLHHQVRFMVGGVVAVGRGRLSLEELIAALRAGKRPGIVQVEPACGLTFTRVEFAEGKNPFQQHNQSGEAQVV